MVSKVKNCPKKKENGVKCGLTQYIGWYKRR